MKLYYLVTFAVAVVWNSAVATNHHAVESETDLDFFKDAGVDGAVTDKRSKRRLKGSRVTDRQWQNYIPKIPNADQWDHYIPKIPNADQWDQWTPYPQWETYYRGRNRLNSNEYDPYGSDRSDPRWGDKCWLDGYGGSTCDTGEEFCNFDYGSSGHCQPCPQDRCDRQTTPEPGVRDCKVKCEPEYCQFLSNHSTCSTGNFCNFEDGDAGECEPCPLHPCSEVSTPWAGKNDCFAKCE